MLIYIFWNNCIIFFKLIIFCLNMQWKSPSHKIVWNYLTLRGPNWWFYTSRVNQANYTFLRRWNPKMKQSRPPSRLAPLERGYYSDVLNSSNADFQADEAPNITENLQVCMIYRDRLKHLNSLLFLFRFWLYEKLQKLVWRLLSVWTTSF